MPHCFLFSNRMVEVENLPRESYSTTRKRAKKTAGKSRLVKLEGYDNCNHWKLILFCLSILLEFFVVPAVFFFRAVLVQKVSQSQTTSLRLH